MMFALVAGGHTLLAVPGLIWPGYLDSPIGLALVWPFLSVYLLHALGVPGLLQNQGACGWGWCAPSAAGWLAIGLVWLLAALALAWLLCRMFAGRSAPQSPGSGPP